MDKKTCVVVPTNREQSINEFLKAWKDIFNQYQFDVMVIEDNKQPTLRINEPYNYHFTWKDIDGELNNCKWIIPRQTDCVRSFGYYMGYKIGYDYIITLDDDCFPADKILEHITALNNPVNFDLWYPTISPKPRGFPYYKTERNYETLINHGLWYGVPDYDAPTQLYQAIKVDEINYYEGSIPKGKYFPMCGMNLAFKREAVPMMYFLLMGKNYTYDRFGDIWCGLFAKKICDHLGYAIKSGKPFVYHERASNVYANLSKEMPGYEINESLWQRIDNVVLTKTTIVECYTELADSIDVEGKYWENLNLAMVLWAELF